MNSTAAFVAAQDRLIGRVGVPATSRFVEVPAVEGNVHVLVSGSGPPVVMVPGFGDPAALWAPLMGGIDGFTLHAVDRPCFGLTASAPHTTASIRPLAVAFLEQVLDALGLERPILVGNSIGSLWSFWLALERPHRVLAMSHIGCPAFLLGTSAPLPMRLLSVPAVGRVLMGLARPSTRQVERFAAMAGEDLSRQPEICELLLAMQRLPGVPRALRELMHAVVRLRGPRPEVELTEAQLAAITQPVQLVWGDRDPFGSLEVAGRAAELLPEAELHVVENGGHVPWLTQPLRVAAPVRRFLRQQVFHAAATA